MLPARTFKEFRGECITWNAFCSQVESRELSKYGASIHVVNTFGDKTMDVMELFENEVMQKKYSAEEADVILSTTHAAKGMEWEHVQVCNDFADIFKVSFDGPLKAQRGSAGSNAKRNSWQFHIKGWGDDINLLYVACTRAKKLLSIPQSLKTFLQECDMMHDMIRRKNLYKVALQEQVCKSSEIAVFGRDKPFTVCDALNVYEDVVVPLRIDNGLQTKDRLMKALVQPLDDEADYDDDKALEGDDEFEHFFDYSTKRAAAASTSVNATTMPAKRAATSNPNAGATSPANAVVKPEVNIESATKKQKHPRAFYVLEEAKAAAAHAPKGIARPYDKIDTAVVTARCRECGVGIQKGEKRVGVQVYKPEASKFWCSYFHHDKCFPIELFPRLRLDRNPKKPAAKKSSNGKRSFGGGGYHNNWKRGGGYKRRWN